MQLKKCWDPVMIPSFTFFITHKALPFSLLALSSCIMAISKTCPMLNNNYLWRSKPSLSHTNHRLHKTVCVSEIHILLIALSKSFSSSSVPGKWVIQPSELTFVQEIGSGQFGLVHLGYWLNKDKVAIKTIQEGAMSEEDFIEEAEVMMWVRARVCRRADKEGLGRVCKIPLWCLGVPQLSTPTT